MPLEMTQVGMAPPDYFATRPQLGADRTRYWTPQGFRAVPDYRDVYQTRLGQMQPPDYFPTRPQVGQGPPMFDPQRGGYPLGDPFAAGQVEGDWGALFSPPQPGDTDYVAPEPGAVLPPGGQAPSGPEPSTPATTTEESSPWSSPWVIGGAVVGGLALLWLWMR